MLLNTAASSSVSFFLYAVSDPVIVSLNFRSKEEL